MDGAFGLILFDQNGAPGEFEQIALLLQHRQIRAENSPLPLPDRVGQPFVVTANWRAIS